LDGSTILTLHVIASHLLSDLLRMRRMSVRVYRAGGSLLRRSATLSTISRSSSFSGAPLG
jgi:hypothetical protein